jgi:serine/threonine-protein kinase
MELVTGTSLDEKLRGSPLPVDVALGYARQLAAALAAAHAIGVRHRDVKPSNVVIRADGVLKLVDFGVALDEEADRLTRAGTFLGTPEYAPPEWMSGQVDPTAWDAYAFGVVLYEMLMGDLPERFRRDGKGRPLEQAIRLMTWKEEHPALAPGPGAPTALRALVGALTEPDPRRRQTSMERVLGLLSDVHWDKPGSTLIPVRLDSPRIDSLAVRVPMAARRATLALGAASALAVLGVGTVAVVAAVAMAVGAAALWNEAPPSASPGSVPEVRPPPEPAPPHAGPQASTTAGPMQPLPVPPPPAPRPDARSRQLPPEPVAPLPEPAAIASEAPDADAPEPQPQPHPPAPPSSSVRLSGDAVRVRLQAADRSILIGRDEIAEIPAGIWQIEAMWRVGEDYKRAGAPLRVVDDLPMVL